MATQWANPPFVDGDWSVPNPNLPVFESPIDATTKPYVFTQQFTQGLEFWEPEPLNSPHDSAGMDPDYSDYFLVKEGPRQDIGGGMVKWTRTYAIVPDSYDDFQSYSYPFIGIVGVIQSASGFGGSGTPNPVQVTGRPRLSHTVTTRVRHDFFKVGPGAPYASAGNIPIVPAQDYVMPSLGNTFPVEQLDDARLSIPATIPSRTTYLGWIANVVAATSSNPWGVAVGSGQFVAEDSRLTRWRNFGTIFERETRYILAQ